MRATQPFMRDEPLGRIGWACAVVARERRSGMREVATLARGDMRVVALHARAAAGPLKPIAAQVHCRP
jgi:hypothetical protein